MSIELFMSSVPAQVTIETADDGTHLVRGLPVLQEGVWNGRTYSAADLQAMAANFADIQQTDAWEPPMRPFHGYGADGKPLVQDARDVLGWHKAARYDADTKRLLMDLAVPDEKTVEAIRKGTLRYVSGEVFRSGYKSPVTGKEYDTPVYVGAAFVDNPAVKGMPWQIVTNAADYRGGVETFASWAGNSADTVRSLLMEKHGGDMAWVRDLYEDNAIIEEDSKCYRVKFSFDRDGNLKMSDPVEVKQEWVEALTANGQTANQKGAVKKPMTFKERIEQLKASLKGAGVADDKLAEIDQLAQDPPDDKGGADPNIARQLEQLEQSRKEQAAEIEQLRAERAAERAVALVDGYVTGGLVPPVMRPQALALVESLSAVAEVETLAFDETGKQAGTRKVAAVELLGEILAACKPELLSAGKGNVFAGKYSDKPEQLSAEEVEKEAERLTASR